MKRDPYEVLGVARDADSGQIKKTFRRLARDLHPDTNREDPATEERFKEAAEAYEILSDPQRRSIYDRYGHEGLSSQGFASSAQGFGSFADIFDAFFGGGGGDPFGGAFGGRARGGGAQGGDVAVTVEVSLAEAATGTEVEAEYEAVVACEQCHGNGAEPGTPIETCPQCGGAGQVRTVSRTAFGQMVRSFGCDRCGGEGKIAQTPCRRCQGRGREAARRNLTIDVPPGINDGQRIRIGGRGHTGQLGGAPGDLYVVVNVTPDERFVRDGNDLVTVVDLPATDAALGTSVAVPTLDGERQIEIEPGTQPGAVIALPGLGMPSLGRGRRGDQRVVVNVMVPRNLSQDQRERLERFADTLGPRNLEEEDSARDSIFARVKRALG
ncbi:MAG: molecular chaperone DnaJ [Actinomycetota bacterium]|nr:molecular chaperone DnaJ [Actinomycetota bacterium]